MTQSARMCEGCVSTCEGTPSQRKPALIKAFSAVRRVRKHFSHGRVRNALRLRHLHAPHAHVCTPSHPSHPTQRSSGAGFGCEGVASPGFTPYALEKK